MIDQSTSQDGPIYVVKDGHTLGYLTDKELWMGVLAGSVVLGGHSWLNGSVAIGRLCRIRKAGEGDFEFFRVKVPPNFEDCQKRDDPRITDLSDQELERFWSLVVPYFGLDDSFLYETQTTTVQRYLKLYEAGVTK